MALNHKASQIDRPRVFGNFRPDKFRTRPTPQERARKSAKKREGDSEAHLALIRRLWCTVTSQRRNVQAHHLQGAPTVKLRGLGLKSPDRMAVPLAMDTHWSLHSRGSRHEPAFFDAVGINPYALADALWAATGDLSRMARVLEAHQDDGKRIVREREKQAKAAKYKSGYLGQRGNP